MFPTVLIVDDEPSILQSLTGILGDEGFDVISASNGYEALKIIDGEAPDLVLLDIWMPGIDGIETLIEIKKRQPAIQVIIITGHGTIETAVKATKLGAFDLIEKPLSIDKMIVAINNALNFRRLEEENRFLRKKTIEKHAITGSSPATQALKKQIAVAAPAGAWILITGENGTGKELVARTIHQLSPRAEEPLVDVNCAAIPEELVESELFGNERGVLPGAIAKKRGKFELAGKGTLFLDEVGDMTPRTQAMILRVLQQGEFQRLGGSRTLQFSARVIAASNKDLQTEIVRGAFREDLFYRLNVVPIQVPPLRVRVEDIAPLADTFLKEFAHKGLGTAKTLAPGALALLRGYSWPGNVRELKNLMERLAITVESETIPAGAIPAPYNPEYGGGGGAIETRLFACGTLKEARQAFEEAFIRRKLADHGNDPARTARAIGVDLRQVRRHIP
jgi:two-component system nitrogen regulation response regulator NtrX